jgi:hypothetical protein
MNIGFTGTRNGMTKEQQDTFVKLPCLLKVEAAHHGDCVGSDAQFHFLMRCFDEDIPIIGHPGFSAKSPDDTINRAFCGVDETREAKSHFARNRDIVNESDILIATPPTMNELPNGGTWYTINYARKVGKPRIIIWPDGSVNEEDSTQ